ncbi:uncharacterized protein LOC136064548 [Quercus suber]|uniref:uncharacterized protein LOC136064548 n=1 Tax=Quercus suber TaxID=58331 RepID=UPI0032DEDE01
MAVACLSIGEVDHDPKRAKASIPPILGFLDEDKFGTIQPHDGALVITLRIRGYDVKSVMVDQGNATEIMYLDLYKRLNLKPDDLTPYSSPLTGAEIVEVDFIVVDVYSPYTAIMARPWLHMLGAVSSTLHQRVKYLSEGQEKEALIEFLKRNIDVFAWNAYEAPRVDPKFICHHLKVNPLITLKIQPPRRPFREHADAVREEVMKLKQAGAINEVFYPE